MKRRDLPAFLGGAAALGPLAAGAQAANVPRIGFLATGLATMPGLHDAFRRGLRDLGYDDGRNVSIEYRDADGKLGRLPALAAELVAVAA